MKKFLIIFGSFVLFVNSVGFLFKIMHWPGAGPMLVVGLTLFAVFYLPLFFISRMIEKKTALNIITNIFALLSTHMIFMGVEFKIMHWSGAAPMIVFGTLMLWFPTLILYVIQQFKEYDRKFSEFARMVIFVILTGVFLITFGTNVTRNILYSFLKIEDATIETNNNLREMNAMLISDIKADSSFWNVDVSKITLMSDEMVQFIDDIKTELVTYTEKNPYAPDDHWQMSSLDNYDIPTHFLCQGGQRGEQLVSKLMQYKKSMIEEMKALPFENKEQIVERLGDLGVKTELKPQLMEEFQTWEDGMFYQQTIAGTLAILTSVETEVLNAEFRCLKIIKKKGK